LGYDFERHRILNENFVAEKVVRPWPDRRLRPWHVRVIVCMICKELALYTLF